MNFKKRKIDLRFIPQVKGIDLWQSMNFIDLADVSLKFVYDCYTAKPVSYIKGSRPRLEKILKQIVGKKAMSVRTITAVGKWVAEEVPWAGYYALKKNRQLPTDRNLSEEKIIQSKFAWCNEQARVLCSLLQIAGRPCRLVFGCNSGRKYGHVTVEVLTPSGWMLIDQSFGLSFVYQNKPVSAWDVCHNKRSFDHFTPIYQGLCQDLIQKLGIKILERDFKMSTVKNPLTGFESLGFCNHYV